MEEETIYEIILKTQCDSYNQILFLLDRISRCDDGLVFEAAKDTPSVQKLSDFTNHKNYLISEIDKLSLFIADNQVKLNGVMSLLISPTSHPLWERLTILQELVERKLSRIILNEDRVNPALCESLTQYKERLELDIKIAEVPLNKRKIFFFDPKA